MRVRIAPLERLELPPELDGHRGKFRCARDTCEIDADTDLAAARIWLSGYEKRDVTFRAYRLDIERLMNWSVVERRLPVSSLDSDDLNAFEEFLSDPQPFDRWTCPRNTKRIDDRWTPFVGPLEPASRLRALSILRTWCNWMRAVGYCKVGLILNRHRSSLGVPYVPSSLILRTPQRKPIQAISFHDWHVLRESLANTGNRANASMERLVIELLYYAGLGMDEVAAVRDCDIASEGDNLTLTVPSRGTDLYPIYVVPPLKEALQEVLGLGARVRWRCDAGLLSPESDLGRNRFFRSTNRVYLLAREAIQRAADYAAGAGDLEAADRLRALTPRRLRHALELHAIEHGVWKEAWQLTGVDRTIDGTVTDLDPVRRRLSVHELAGAFEALSVCWRPELSRHGCSGQALAQ